MHRFADIPILREEIGDRCTQVTILGPVPFPIIVDDITAVKPEKICQSNRQINIQRWATENTMELNISKTSKVILRGRTSKLVPDPLKKRKRKPEHCTYNLKSTFIESNAHAH